MVNSRELKELHPTLQRGATELKRRLAAAGYPMGICSTYRDIEMQNKLYYQSRTTPPTGPYATSVKGGNSYHNHRLAFDIFKNASGQAFNDDKFFRTAGRLWKEMGGIWGGDFVGFYDAGHLQFSNGLTTGQLLNGTLLPQNFKMKWEQAATPVQAKGADVEMVEKTIVLFEGKEVTVDRILKDNTNYIKLRDLEKFGMKVTYDEVKKIAVIKKG